MVRGSGTVKLDDELVEVQPRYAIRIAPSVARAFEAGPEGLEFLAIGSHHPGDRESVDNPCVSYSRSAVRAPIARSR